MGRGTKQMRPKPVGRSGRWVGHCGRRDCRERAQQPLHDPRASAAVRRVERKTAREERAVTRLSQGRRDERRTG